jgi:Tfp pilus assembly protein PilN
MKQHSVSFNINLIPRDPFFDTLLGRTLRWALSVGRYLVVFTELVVIVSFATRFTLDRQVTDLNESLNQKKLVIQSYGDLEANFRTIQARLDDFKQIDQQGNIADIFPKLTAVVPRDVTLGELTVTLDSVYLSGVAPSQKALNTFLNNLQQSRNFFAITVDKIESQGDKSPGFDFTVRANTQEQTKVQVNQPATKTTPNTSPKPATNSKTKPASEADL